MFLSISEPKLLHEMATGGSSTSISGGNQVDGLPPVPVKILEILKIQNFDIFSPIE